MLKRAIVRALTALVERAGGRLLRAGEHAHLLRHREELIGALHGVYTEALALTDTPNRLDLLGRLEGTTVAEALHLLGELERAPDGDVCEFGVAQGATSALLADAIAGGTRHLWLYDSFRGLPEPTEEDELITDVFRLGSMASYAGTMASPRSLVEGRLAEIGFPVERTHIREGFLDPRTAELPDRVALAYVDFDLYRPILAVLQLLDPRLAPGGRIVVDDYGWFSSGVGTAVQEFLGLHPAYTLEVGPLYAGRFCILRAP